MVTAATSLPSGLKATDVTPSFGPTSSLPRVKRHLFQNVRGKSRKKREKEKKKEKRSKKVTPYFAFFDVPDLRLLVATSRNYQSAIF
jgi:hypothetical protein